MSTEFFSQRSFSVEDAERQFEEMLSRNNTIPGFRQRFGYPHQKPMPVDYTKKQAEQMREAHRVLEAEYQHKYVSQNGATSVSNGFRK